MSDETKRLYRSKGPHRTLHISARLDPDSEAGRIVANLLREGWSKSEIVEQAIVTANGGIPKKDSMDQETIINLRNAIDRLEKLAESLSSGTPLTAQQQRLVGELKPEFVQAMKRAARPAFNPNNGQENE